MHIGTPGAAGCTAFYHGTLVLSMCRGQTHGSKNMLVVSIDHMPFRVAV
jgi:hypothetical protein